MNRRSILGLAAAVTVAATFSVGGTVPALAQSKEIVYLTPGLDLPFWESLVTGLPSDYMADGYVKVPEAPGLGLELNLEAIEENLRTPGTMFLPTEQWNNPKLGFWRPDDRWPE